MINVLNKMKHSAKSIKMSSLYKFFVCALLFLFGLDFLSYGSYFLLALICVACLKSVLAKELRINLSFVLTCIFSLLFFGIYTLYFGFSFTRFIYYFIIPIGIFVLGQNLLVTFKDKKRTLFLIFFWISVGFALHAFLNMICRIFEFGYNPDSDSRFAPDIWTGKIIAATGIGMLCPMACSLVFPILFLKSKEKKWYEVIVIVLSFLTSIYTTIMLANRTLFLIIFITLFIDLVALCVFVFRKTKIPLILLGIVTLLCVVGIIIVTNNIFGIADILKKMPLFNRILSDDGLLDSWRFEIYRSFFANFYKYPFGGGKIPLAGSHFCHNVWLDVYNLTGVIPFLIFLVLTIYLIRSIIEICVLSEDSFERIYIISFFLGLTLVFFVEPVIQGNIYIYALFFLLLGVVDELCFEYKFNYRRKYVKTFENMDKCKIVFISNYLSLHQIELCKSFVKEYGERFKFISTIPFPNERIKLGCYANADLNCLIEMHKDHEAGMKALDEADVIIYGSASDKKYIYPQLKKGKIVFKMAERLYRSGKIWEPFKLRSIISQYIHYKRYQPFNMYYLCNSAYTSYDLSRFNINTERCFKSAYFTLKNDYDTYDELYKKKAMNNRVEILFVNRLVKVKHPEKCLVVAKYLKEHHIPFRMRIVGTGDLKIEEQLKKEIQDNGLENSVRLLGAVKNDKVRELMEYSNILLATSDFGEGWGACVNEGMQSGCVVIASHSHGSVPYLIEHNKSGIIYELNNDEELCEQVARVATDRELQYQMGKAAFERMNSLWSSDEFVSRFTNLVETISENQSLDLYDDGPISHAQIFKQDWFKNRKNENINKDSSDGGTPPPVKAGRIRSGAIMSYITIIFGILAGLLYTPWMIATIGEADYSIFILAKSVIALFTIDFGLSSAVSRFLAKYRAEKNLQMANKFMGIVYKLFMLLDSALFIVLLVIYLNLQGLYGKTYDAEQMHKLRIVFAIVGFYTLISFGTRPINGVLQAHERFSFHKGVDLITKITSIVLIVIALLLGYDLYAVVIINCLVNVLGILARFIYNKKHIGIKTDFKYKDKKLTKEIFSFSFWILVIGICQKLIVNITPTLISRYNGASIQITIWSVGLMVEEYSYNLSSALNGLFLPKLSKMQADGATPKQFTSLMIMVGRIQLLLFGLIFVGYAGLGYGFMKIWISKSLGEYFKQAYIVGLLLIFPYLIIFTQKIGETMLIAQNKVAIRSACAIVTSALSLGINLILVAPFGAIGSGIGIFIGRIVGYVILMNILYKYKLKLEMGRFYKEVHLSFVLQMLVVLAFALGLEILLPTNSWIVFFIKGVLVVIAYICIMWITCLRKNEKELVAKIIAPVTRVLKKCNEVSAQ